MSIDDEALARLRSLLAKATPGPWLLSGTGFALSSDRHCIGDGVYGPDADLIVAMRKDIEALLDIAEAVARAPVARVETDGDIDGMPIIALSPDTDKAERAIKKMHMQRVRIVPCTGGAE